MVAICSYGNFSIVFEKRRNNERKEKNGGWEEKKEEKKERRRNASLAGIGFFSGLHRSTESVWDVFGAAPIHRTGVGSFFVAFRETSVADGK